MILFFLSFFCSPWRVSKVRMKEMVLVTKGKGELHPFIHFYWAQMGTWKKLSKTEMVSSDIRCKFKDTFER